MPPAARKADPTMCIIESKTWDEEEEEWEYECDPEPRSVATGSTNVFINGRGAVRQGTDYTTHDPACKVLTGSSSVYINGKQAARLGESVCCTCVNEECGENGVITGGSNNVYIGG